MNIVYQVHFSRCGHCGLLGDYFLFNSKKEVYSFCKFFNKKPYIIYKLTSAISGIEMEIVPTKKGLGWKF